MEVNEIQFIYATKNLHCPSESVENFRKNFECTNPDLLFNFETHDNPTCKYPSSEMISQQIIPIKGVIHHSFFAHRNCAMAQYCYQYHIIKILKLMESTKALDKKVSSIPWKNKIDKLFWRGSNAGKLQEYEYFGWNLPDLPRKHAVKMCKLHKDIDVNLDLYHGGHL